MKYKLWSANICDSWPPSKDLALEVASPLHHLELSQVWAEQTDQWDTSFKGGMRILPNVNRKWDTLAGNIRK